jgi:Na+-translocating ferredoxin:NAD+ oxidoreductase subunit B
LRSYCQISRQSKVFINIANEPNSLNLIEQLDQLLPQTQCQRCGFAACRPYAQAMANGEAAPNRCPPGGQEGVKALSSVLGQDEIALDLSRGMPGVGFVVKIDPAFCIGCTKCIRACPVDAIIGANKRMHTVIADHCTGCELCIPPCPTNCISMTPSQQSVWRPQDALAAQTRYLRRATRLTRDGFETPPEEADDLDNATAQIAQQGLAVKPAEKEHVEARQSALAKALAQARDRLAGRAALAKNQRKPEPPMVKSPGVSVSDNTSMHEEQHAKR